MNLKPCFALSAAVVAILLGALGLFLIFLNMYYAAMHVEDTHGYGAMTIVVSLPLTICGGLGVAIACNFRDFAFCLGCIGLIACMPLLWIVEVMEYGFITEARLPLEYFNGDGTNIIIACCIFCLLGAALFFYSKRRLR